jgi:hypothetical protein
MKRALTVSCIILLLAAAVVYYRHSLVTPSRPSPVPEDAFPCRFGFSLRWVSIGPPRSRDILDGALLKVYDSSGQLVEQERTALATPPRLFDTTQARGSKMYPYETLRDFEFPRGRIAAGSGSGNYIVVHIDAERALVPWWVFK